VSLVLNEAFVTLMSRILLLPTKEYQIPRADDTTKHFSAAKSVKAPVLSWPGSEELMLLEIAVAVSQKSFEGRSSACEQHNKKASVRMVILQCNRTCSTTYTYRDAHIEASTCARNTGNQYLVLFLSDTFSREKAVVSTPIIAALTREIIARSIECSKSCVEGSILNLNLENLVTGWCICVPHALIGWGNRAAGNCNVG